MTEVTLLLDPVIVKFYTELANCAGISLENVLQDALFKLAAELSLEALQMRK